MKFQEIDLKQQIVDEAKAMFMRFGIKSVSMDDIAGKMGISKKTLYLHLENKAELISLILNEKLEEEIAVMAELRARAENAIEEILSISDFVVATLREMPPMIIYDLQKYYQVTWRGFDEKYKAHIYKTILENIKWGVEQGYYRQGLNPDIITKFYVGKAMVVVDDELFPAGVYDCDVLFKEHIEYHIYGIASSKGLAFFEKRKDRKTH
ncbi:MAG: TetR/AcrR family transcriptional regulator [Saprospiraceae bacterium]|nr:TetR/AcrR family transcriptional regulator [Saprospiraceae bacterium]MCB9324524.1 TetR/AcrR family transcriptional regulator [Lewinellaceae bacterium]